MPDEALPLVKPEEAIAILKSKGFQIGFDWRDVWQAEHARAFTVAKVMSRELLEDIREAVTRALDEGLTLQQFAKELRPRLVARGWWGRRMMTDPATGVERVVQLGSPARLRTIYQTNLRTSYMAGKWQRIDRARRALPFLRYVSVMDGRERPEHHAWHGTILPVNHPWWDTHFPPCGWNCRCDVQSLSQRMMARRGLTANEPPRFPVREHVNRRTGEVSRLEQGIDPGWAYHIGKAPLDGLTPTPRQGTGPDTIDSAMQARLSEGTYAPLKAFFAAFELADAEAAIAGRVFTDVAGWPLPISTGLFREAGGELRLPGPADAAALKAAAATIIQPDRIAWLWIEGRDGRAMLVRRYFSGRGVVDMGSRFWRWFGGNNAAFARGQLVWRREAAELAAYDPHQSRDKNGRWQKTGRGPGRMDVVAARTYLHAVQHGREDSPRHDLEPLPNHAARQLERLGLSGNDNKGHRRMIALDSSYLRHIADRHGSDSRGQIPITGDDYLRMPDLLRTGEFNHGTPRTMRGVPRVSVRGTVDGARYLATFEVRKHTIVPTSISRKK